MITRLQKSWREETARTERQTAAALTLPLADYCCFIGYACYGIGALLGAVFGGIYGSVLGAILCAVVGGLLGVFAGWLTNLILLCLVQVIPHPFAWLARRLGYAR
jgi:hypothetical protein